MLGSCYSAVAAAVVAAVLVVVAGICFLYSVVDRLEGCNCRCSCWVCFRCCCLCLCCFDYCAPLSTVTSVGSSYDAVAVAVAAAVIVG